MHQKCHLFVFFPYLLNIYRKFEFSISQGSVATYLRRGEKCHVDFVAISCAFQQCKNFEKRLRFDKVTENLKVGTFLRHSVLVVSAVSKNRITGPRQLHNFTTREIEALTCIYTMGHKNWCQFVFNYKWQFLSNFYACCTSGSRNEYSAVYLLNGLMTSHCTSQNFTSQHYFWNTAASVKIWSSALLTLLLISGDIGWQRVSVQKPDILNTICK